MTYVSLPHFGLSYPRGSLIHTHTHRCMHTKAHARPQKVTKRDTEKKRKKKTVRDTDVSSQTNTNCIKHTITQPPSPFLSDRQTEPGSAEALRSVFYCRRTESGADSQAAHSSTHRESTVILAK